MKEVRKGLQCFTKIGEISTQRKPLWKLAGLCEQLPTKDAKFLPVFECLSVGVVAGGHKEVINLVLAVAEALLGHVIHCVHHLGTENR